MGCIDKDGRLGKTAKKILSVIALPMTPKEVADAVSLPLYAVRGSLRQLEEDNLVEKTADDSYKITQYGKEIYNNQ